jgi:predicted ATPase
LEEESAEEMLGVMLGNEASLRPLKKVILEKSEGVPFFIEEIVQALFDRGVLVRNGGVSLTRPTTEIHVPPTVQGMLAARIDRLQAEEKELLQTAAVAGREFSLALLERVTNRPADGLQRTLARLQAAEFVYEQPASTELDYVFKHALTQEVAYASVLLERRRQLHDRIAQAIESLAANRLHEHYSELAHHYSGSGNTQKAVDYLQLAGEQAAERGAHAEAVAHLTAALELLGTLPASGDHTHQELALQLAIRPALMAVKGYGGRELVRTGAMSSLFPDHRSGRRRGRPGEDRRSDAVLLDEALRDALPLMFDFLGVPDPERPVSQMEPEVRLRQLLAIVKRVAQARSRREPAVLLLEDLHWFDGGSDAVLEVLVEVAEGTRTLIVVNFRPEYHAGWMQKSYYQQMPPLPLGPEAIAELLRDRLGTDPSVTSLGSRIRERTGGNPFFIEEMVQALAEAGSLEGTRGAYRLIRPAAELALPTTVQAVLASRVDRLAEREKQVLQTAAVIGREFTEPVLRRVVELPEIDLAAALRKLASGEFIYEEALYPEAQYTFKHALTQEVASNSLLTERRLTLHEHVGKAIEAIFTGRLEEHLSQLAHHYSRSRNTEKAIEYSQRAGERAVQLSANAEAIGHLTTAIRLLETLPDSPQRIERELSCRRRSACL